MVLQICNKFNKYRSKLLKIITNQNISIISDHVLDLINERIFIMKKILLAISALSAALFSTLQMQTSQLADLQMQFM